MCTINMFSYTKYSILLLCLCAMGTLTAQSNIAAEAGFSESIFYCSQLKSNYYYSFSQYPSYYVNLSYKEDVPQWSRNMRFGGQLGMKRQSQWFYYEDNLPYDTLATGVRYDIYAVNIYVFPEVVVGEKVKFYFSGGPQLHIICNTTAKGTQLQIIPGQEYPETPIKEKHSKDIKGVSFGAKFCLGLEIPLYKDLFLTLNNAYSAGFTGMNGLLKPKMKFFNCIDIYLGAGLQYKINHNKQTNKK